MIRRALVCGLLLFAACGSSDPPDLAGTVSVTMLLGDRLCFGCTGAGTDLTLDTAGNLHGLIAPLGPLSGIGAVTKTTAVSQLTTTATAGEGYVVKANNAFDSYYALYVTDYAESASGGELGVYLKWAPLSAVVSLTVVPDTVTVAVPATGMNSSPSIAVTLSYSDGHSVDAHKSTVYTVPVCSPGSPCPTVIDDPADSTRLIVQIKPATQPGTWKYTYQASPYAAKATLSVITQ
jgi:hypothetical protein